MATPKTKKPTKSTRPTAKKTATANAANAKSNKAKTPMTADEAVMIAWQHDYDTRHKPTNRRERSTSTPKTPRGTKSARAAASKRESSSNGGRTGLPKKTVAPEKATGRKKLEQMTTEELGQLAWETSYRNRHKRLDQNGSEGTVLEHRLRTATRSVGPGRELRVQQSLEPEVPVITPAPVKPVVPVSLLQQLDIRVGTILAVEDVPTSKKLVRLVVDFGDHRRNILAGMKTERSDPSAITGLQALFVVNLEPRTMAGEQSEGMLFDIGYEDGVTPVLAIPEAAVPNGTRAG